MHIWGVVLGLVLARNTCYKHTREYLRRKNFLKFKIVKRKFFDDGYFVYYNESHPLIKKYIYYIIIISHWCYTCQHKIRKFENIEWILNDLY